MRPIAIAALALVVLPVGALAQASPSPGPNPTPTLKASTPTEVGCYTLFESAGTPTSSGGPTALHERRYPIEGYTVRETAFGRFVVGTAAADPDLVSSLAADVAQKYVFLKISFVCPARATSVPNAVIVSASKSGSAETFSVKDPTFVLPHPPIPRPHISATM